MPNNVPALAHSSGKHGRKKLQAGGGNLCPNCKFYVFAINEVYFIFYSHSSTHLPFRSSHVFVVKDSGARGSAAISADEEGERMRDGDGDERDDGRDNDDNRRRRLGSSPSDDNYDTAKAATVAAAASRKAWRWDQGGGLDGGGRKERAGRWG